MKAEYGRRDKPNDEHHKENQQPEFYLTHFLLGAVPNEPASAAARQAKQTNKILLRLTLLSPA
jgi:hypothetical protein